MWLQVVIGPATVGGIQAGAFKIGDTAGTIDNIIQCKLYRPGSVGFVSKSVCIHTSLILSNLFALYIYLEVVMSDIELNGDVIIKIPFQIESCHGFFSVTLLACP